MTLHPQGPDENADYDANFNPYDTYSYKLDPPASSSSTDVPDPANQPSSPYLVPGPQPMPSPIPPPRSKNRGPWIVVSILLGVTILACVFAGIVGRNYIIFNTRPGDLPENVVAANPDPYPHHHGTLKVLDPLNAPNNNLINSSNCTVNNGAYHITALHPHSTQSCLQAFTFTNFAFEVEMTIIQGDCGGVTFTPTDVNGINDTSFLFGICLDGGYLVDVSQGDNNQGLAGHSSSFHPGLNQKNVLALVIDGQKLDFYVNHQLTKSISSYGHTFGKLGLVAYSLSSPADIAYTNEREWEA